MLGLALTPGVAVATGARAKVGGVSLDVTAPILTNFALTGAAPDPVLSATASEPGTLYYVWTTTTTPIPTATIETNAIAANPDQIAVLITGANNGSLLGVPITVGSHYLHAFMKDAAGNSSVEYVSGAYVVAAAPVQVVVWAGQSQIGGARSVKADITGYAGLATDNNCFIWDCPSQTIMTLVPGVAELQPSLALMDPAFTDTVGPLGEFDRFFRRENPITPLYHFKYTVGGSRFTNAGSLGADANWSPGIAGGAREKMLANWTAFVAALAAQGKTPVVTFMATDLGYSSSTVPAEMTAYQADMTALIAWWRTNMIGATARLTIARASNGVTASGFDIASLRVAQANIRDASPTVVELMTTDDFEMVADNIHFTAAAHMIQGERTYCHYTNRWYPHVDRVNGAAIFPTDFYRLGHLSNTYIGSTKTGNISTLWDFIRGRIAPITMTQTTDANRPLLVTETLGGLSVRLGRFDGVSDRIRRTVGRMAGSAPWGCCFALRVATPALPAVVIGEGLSTNLQPFVTFRTDVDARIETFSRDTTGAVLTGPFDWTTTTAAGDVMRAFAASYDGTNVIGAVDATVGGANAFPLAGLVATDRVTLGAVTTTVTLQFSDTDIAEVWWTNIALDAAYRTKVLVYMQWRWGTP